MKRLARIFSALTLAVLVWAGWLMLAPQPGQRPNPNPTPGQPAPTAALTGKLDRIVIDKGERRLTAYRDGQALKSYRIALGFAPGGDKRKQGDGRTPEGLFHIDRRNAASAYHLSLGIDYPRAEDRARARREGIDPGGDIFIHGQPNQRPSGEILTGDWTAGCIAVSDAEIAELFAATQIGTPVEIRP